LKSCVWVALIAILGVALGPSISRALAPAALHASGATAQRMDMAAHAHMGHMAPMAASAQPDSGAHPDAPGHSSCLLDCCALCAVAASPFAAVALFVPVWSATESAARPPADRSQARPDPRAAWPRASPRGPPLSLS
jgi:Protein of unknown function (DUF2946)